jgi:hypothetical protein
LFIRRGLYDECGEVDDENDPLQQNKDWEEYWRVLFPKVIIFLKKIKDSLCAEFGYPQYLELV